MTASASLKRQWYGAKKKQNALNTTQTIPNASSQPDVFLV